MKSKTNRRDFLGKTMFTSSVALAAAGAKALAADETANEARSGIKRHGRFCVVASETGTKLDSNVETGGGTDDTEILQSVLDKALEYGSLHLILDGAALVRGLKIHSNTTIECPTRACGLFMKGGTNAPVLRNANPKSKDGRVDKNITLLGGTYNHNCPEQAHDYPQTESARPISEIPDLFEDQVWNFTFEFFGVENFTARDLTIRDQRTFALLMGNFYRVVFENIYIDAPHKVDAQNQDGLHFWGPGQFLTLRNIQGDAGDDFIALAPDENDLVSDITDVVIDTVHLKDADQGIRLLSRHKGRLDRVVIRNVTGTYRSYGFFIEPWFNATGGNYGNIVFDTVDLRPVEPNYDYRTPFLFSAGGTIESLVLKNIYLHAPSDERIAFDFGKANCMQGLGENGDIPQMKIRSILIDGLRVFDPKFTDEQPAIINVAGPIDNLTVCDVEVIADDAPKAGVLVRVENGGTIGKLALDRVDADALSETVRIDEGGKVVSQR